MEAYPLEWPLGYKRTANRINSLFKQSMDKAQQFLRLEIQRMGATGLIVSTNIPVRRDGGLYTDYMNRRMDDPGVAIFFKYHGKDVTMACDQYLRVWENIYALGKAIESLRGLERWGVSEILDRAFTGFAQLPPPAVLLHAGDIWEILGLPGKPATIDVVKTAYRDLCQIHHPDKPTGNRQTFDRITWAYDEARKQFNG